MPAGYKIAAHQHPTAEAVTVISGELSFGMGDKLDGAKAQKLGPGGFVYLPANMNHFAFASGDTIIQINAEGPFAIKYANPADDPKKRSDFARFPFRGSLAFDRLEGWLNSLAGRYDPCCLSP